MFVRFHLDSRLLCAALSDVPEMKITAEQFDTSRNIPLRIVFWATGDDFGTFEAGLESDETVDDFSILAEERTRRLYRVRCPETLPDVEAYRRTVDLDGVILNAATSGDGWTVKMLFPDRDAFAGFRDTCAEVGLAATVESIHSGSIERNGAEADLTSAQKEILTRAVEVGYFDIPRQTTLRGLGEEVGVSGQAASERLRRGMETLVRETLSSDLEEQ
ncbi:helix-turn-helix domain-containing protein [Haloarchaeobius sp. TZWWS8]|uniref:helix-turn-helix domain-containing protein n=1 Tax=Haloarchaeobius sp. TZWWS8 TaxID=3446121 RepID=UPI003EC1497A